MASGPSRRAFVIAPFVFGGWWLLLRRPSRVLPDPSAEGNGPFVTLVLCSNDGEKRATQMLRKIVKTDAEWHAELFPEVYAVTRQAHTEFAFANKLWDERRPGLYRCVCCATALFRSREKFDSGTGWPSFTAPVAAQNIATAKIMRSRKQGQKCCAQDATRISDTSSTMGRCPPVCAIV
jgi:peptide-methionine (R)-S-oxide reductase